MAETYKTDPCPFTVFCGSDNTSIVAAADYKNQHNGRMMFQARCNECYAKGPTCKTPKRAALAWNKRSGDAPQTTKTEEHEGRLSDV